MKKSFIFLSAIVVIALLSLVTYIQFFLTNDDLLPPLTMIVVILIVCMFLLFGFIAKTSQRTEIYEKITSETKKDEKSLSNDYPSEVVEKYKDYIIELESYVKKHRAKGRELNQIYLKDAGWNDEIIELILDKEFGKQAITEEEEKTVK